jgi:1,2-phenylacetyl-CoA epoxidase catalytic subunit
VDFLKQPMPATWAEICFHQLVAARLAQVASLALFGSSLIPLGVWAGRHFEAQESLANLWLARAAGLDRSVARDVGQPVVDACFPYALDAFGGDDTQSEETYCNSGVKTAANSHVRRIFVDVMGRDLAGLGVNVPDPTRGVRATYKR